MAKGKRKSRRIKVSPERIRQAQWAKQHGLLSKKTKLTGGRLSPSVKKKVETLGYAQALPTFTYRQGMKRTVIDEKPKRVPVKASRAQIEEAKKRGILTVGNNLIISKEPEYKEAVKEGKTAGVLVSQNGSIDVIVLSEEGIENYKDLRKALRSGKIDKKYLRDDRVYAFTYMEHNPKLSRTFLSGPELAEYLERYQWTEEAFEGFELMTLPDGTSLGPTPEYIRARDRAKYGVDSRRPKRRKRRKSEFSEKKRTVSAEEQREKHKQAQHRYVLKQKQRNGELYVKLESTKRSERRRKGFDFT